MKLKRWDVVMDLQGELYVVFGFPCLTEEFVTLLNGRTWYDDFIVRDTAYVNESFIKIGVI